MANPPNPTLRPFQIYLADVPYDEKPGSTYRPALVMIPHVGQTRIYKVTTRYDDKSSEIKDVYYPIKNWKQAGLDKQSYVDVHKTYEVPTRKLTEKKLKGALTAEDSVRLVKYIKDHQDEIQSLARSAEQRNKENAARKAKQEALKRAAIQKRLKGKDRS